MQCECRKGLTDILNARVYAIYNDNAIIVERVKKELKDVSDEMLYKIYRIYKICERENRYIKDSCLEKYFICYLLNITKTNPLKKHYFCVKCGYIEFITPLNVMKSCPLCEGKLSIDGI